MAQSELRTGPMHAAVGAKRKAEGEHAGNIAPVQDPFIVYSVL